MRCVNLQGTALDIELRKTVFLFIQGNRVDVLF